MDRRQFIALGGAALLVGAGSRPVAASAAVSRALYASCGTDPEGRYFAAGFEPSGAIVFRVPIAERGHDIAFRPTGAEAVIFARRPGTTMHVVDLTTGRIARSVDAAAGRHYYGHGVFTRDGRTLYVTENDYDDGTGIIGVYDPDDGYRRTGEFRSGGIGPHQLHLMPDGASLIVANGGILTHPDTGRAKLNIEDMAPNLSLVDMAHGTRLWTACLPQPLHKLSIRHLDVNGDGTIAFGMQYEGDVRDRVPLIALAEPHGAIRFVDSPGGVDLLMHQYTGSVRFDGSGRFLAVTSPPGGVVGFWDVRSGGFLRDVPARGASGLAPAGAAGEFLMTGGDGAIRHVSATGATAVELRPADREMLWDNHLATRPLPLRA